MVALQCLVVLGVAASTILPACGSSDQCHQAGTYCAVGVNDRCYYCGDTTPLPPQTDPATGGSLNDPYAPGFVGYNLTAVRELCADPSVAPPGEWATASSVMSWCKPGNDALDLFIPRAFLAQS
jgi:hypothetical protein